MKHLERLTGSVMNRPFDQMSATYRSDFALRFMGLSVVLLSIAWVLSWMLQSMFPMGLSHQSPTKFPRAFGVSSVLLFCGSATMARAVSFVKRERQRPFRHNLSFALLTGTSFVGIQIFALSRLIQQQPAEEALTGAGAFVAVAAVLHAMHFVVALLFLVYVTVQAHADRYDHEYYWGVSVCAWFWHVLGIMWCVVLAIMMIVSC